MNTTTPTNFACPLGHYCPIGTEYDTQFPCEPGTYNNMTQVGSIILCGESEGINKHCKISINAS